MTKSKITFSHVFKTIIWPRKKLIFLGLLLIIISRLAGLVLPGSTKFLMDDVIAKGDLQVLKMLLIVVTIAIIVQSITSFLLTKLLSVEAQHLISVLRARVQKQLLRLPVRYFDNNKSGALVSRVMTDVEGVRNLVGTGLVQLIGGLLTAIVSLVLLLRISPSMTLFTLIPIIRNADTRLERRRHFEQPSRDARIALTVHEHPPQNVGERRSHGPRQIGLLGEHAVAVAHRRGHPCATLLCAEDARERLDDAPGVPSGLQLPRLVGQERHRAAVGRHDQG